MRYLTTRATANKDRVKASGNNRPSTMPFLLSIANKTSQSQSETQIYSKMGDQIDRNEMLNHPDYKPSWCYRGDVPPLTEGAQKLLVEYSKVPPNEVEAHVRKIVSPN